MATITSAASGPWSAGSTWAGGAVPADNDTVVIAAGHSVEFDVDMSAWANGVAGLTIQGHATTPAMLYAKHSAAGTYYLKLKTGTLIQGTNAAKYGRLLANSDGVWGHTGTLPFDRKFIIDLGATGSVNATYLDIDFRCTEPTHKYVLVTGHTVGSPVITTTTDVTADPQWAPGARVVLADEGPDSYDQQRTTLASVDSATQITLGANVDSAQYDGAAKVWLVSRNVEVRSSCTTNVNILNGGKNNHYGCAIISTAGTGTTFYGFGINSGSGHTVSGTVTGCTNGINSGSGHTVSGTVTGCTNGIYYGSVRLFGATISGNARDLFNCMTSGSATLGSTVQNGAYKYSTVTMTELRYTALVYSLGGVDGAIACWTQGGYCKSAAYSEATHGMPPTTPALIHEQMFEDDNRYCYVELPYMVPRGSSMTVRFHGRLTSTATVTDLPRIEIVDVNKPWLDGDVLASSQMAANTDWQTHIVTWENTGADKEVMLRVRVKGGTPTGTGTDMLYWYAESVDIVSTELQAELIDAVAAIKAKTDNLPADTAGAIAALPTDADVQAAAQAAIVAQPVTLATDQPFYAPTTWRDLEPLATETTLAAVKAKTDNLPLSPAATGDAMTLTAAEHTSVASAVWAATTRTLTDGTGSIQLTFRMLLDSDNDGIPDDPPVGVPDVRCLLFTDAAGTQPVGAVKLTDTQGYARWYGLAAGTYYMRREKAGMLFDDDPLVVEVVEPV